MTPENVVLTGDCVELMAGLDAESVDAIVTDPPYGLGFMGKAWDGPTQMSGHATPDKETVGFYQAVGKGGRHDGGMDNWRPNWMQSWHESWAREAFRIAKPSAYLLAFGGTRTVHRMTVALEDAGWIIRDMLVWGYASGFPKSKASLKPAWEPIVMARKPGPLRMLAIDECRIPMSAEDAEVIEAAGGFMQSGWEKKPTGIYNTNIGDGMPTADAKAHPAGRWPANIVLTDPIFDGGVEGVVGGGMASTGSGWAGAAPSATFTGVGGTAVENYGDSGTYSRFFLIPRDSRSDALSGIIGTCHICGAPIAETPSTARTRQLDTAPSSAVTPPPELPAQPAFDAVSPSPSPAIVTAPRRARTPRDGTLGSTASEAGSSTASDTNATTTSSWSEPQPDTASPLGQPARIAEPSRTSIDTTTTTPAPWMCGRCADDATHGRTLPPPRLIGREPQLDEPNYTRFLIIPKADRTDREPVLAHNLEPKKWSDGRKQPDKDYPSLRGARARANSHPTVKPVDLMRHLVRLVTPPDGLVLDPFLGSGTTALACELEGFRWLGIEREAEYVAIAEARLNGTQRGLGLVG